MADRYWVDDDVSGLWDAANNWALASGGAGGAGVPGAADKAIFDGGNVTNCRLDAAMNITELSALAAYTGTIDGATDDLNHAISGDVILDCTQIDMGDGTWTVNGNFDNKDVTVFNRNDGTVKMTGTGKVITSAAGHRFDKLTIDGATITTTTSFGVRDVLTIINTATFTIDAGDVVLVKGAGDIVVSATGTNKITGSGSLTLESDTSVSVKGGVIDVAVLNINDNHNADIVAGTYESATVNIRNVDAASAHTFTGAGGTYTFAGNVTFDAATGQNYTVDNSVNNPDFVFHGAVTVSEGGGGTFTWTKGTGTITLNGPSNRNIDFMDETIEDLRCRVTMNGIVTFTGGWTADSFDAGSGCRCILDFNGQTLITAGNFTIGEDAQIINAANAMNGVTITVGGALSLTGESGDLLTFRATAAWTLNVTGAAAAVYVRTQQSDASAGAEVQATLSIDGGGNLNWNFISVPVCPVGFQGCVIGNSRRIRRRIHSRGRG